ncbi:hypothetical protein [Paenibacillus odorifer]|uniref:hypothetical protein n=1 Tax=Paenibacillus odorifer TaxID=189426 RepID=UPI000BA0C433|nr:hypothetical protein [Paenibacillus odorifer]OZQ66554.1 hypothetical protein CA596_27420 [Paenibacillus odorifer]
MKKSIIALLTACVLITGTSAFATTSSLVGKKVAKEVVIEKNGVKSAKMAVIIDGVTYAPVRDIAEGAGYSVTYKGDVISLQSAQKIAEEPTSTSDDSAKSEIIRLQNSIKSYKSNIEIKDTYELKIDKQNLAEHLAKGGTDARDIAVTEIIKKKIKDSEDYISEQQALITAAEIRIADIKTQLGQ